MAKTVVIKDKLDLLPLSTLDWERFQVFCTDVLSLLNNIVEARDYLVKGYKQDGIDIYAFEGGGKSRKVAQCKRVAKMTASLIDNIIEEFMKGQFANDTEEFILCTSASMNTIVDEKRIIAAARTKLSTKNITLRVWDQQGLSQYLRANVNPALVYRYFDIDVAQAFYGEIWKDYLSTLQKVPKILYPNPSEHIARSVSLYINGSNRKPSESWLFNAENHKRGLIEVLAEKKDNEPKRIALLSIAGFGKSQELQSVAAFFSRKNHPVHPVRYFLQDYLGQSIEELLNKHNDKWLNIPQENILLIFDGLDELKEDISKIFYDNLNMFSDLNKKVNILISSRYNFYDIVVPPLRSFDVYTLDTLTYENIQKYLEKKLTTNKIDFETKLHNSKFTEYANNPYYLTRLVKYYIDEKALPKNKSALFNKVLFEQLSSDESKYNRV